MHRKGLAQTPGATKSPSQKEKRKKEKRESAQLTGQEAEHPEHERGPDDPQRHRFDRMEFQSNGNRRADQAKEELGPEKNRLGIGAADGADGAGDGDGRHGVFVELEGRRG